MEEQKQNELFLYNGVLTPVLYLLRKEFQMVAIQGYFEGDRFFPEKRVKIPQGKRAIVTILDEPAVDWHERNKNAWLKFLKDISECDEPLESEPERTNFSRTL